MDVMCSSDDIINNGFINAKWHIELLMTPYSKPNHICHM